MKLIIQNVKRPTFNGQNGSRTRHPRYVQRILQHILTSHLRHRPPACLARPKRRPMEINQERPYTIILSHQKTQSNSLPIQIGWSIPPLRFPTNQTNGIPRPFRSFPNQLLEPKLPWTNIKCRSFFKRSFQSPLKLVRQRDALTKRP